MYSSQEESYRDLNQIIANRQDDHQKKLEAHKNSKDSEKPYFATYPTTLNYKDIRGYALIHYAAMIGDVNKIDYCINGKADVNLDFSDFNLPLAESHKSPLQMALENGHLEAAKKLYEAGANVESVRLNLCSNEACRTWLKNLIADALSSAYPDPNKIESGPKQENRFFKSFDYDKTGSIRNVLARAIEVGNTDFLDACAINNSNGNSTQFFTALQAILQDVLKKDNVGIYYPEQA